MQGKVQQPLLVCWYTQLKCHSRAGTGLLYFIMANGQSISLLRRHTCVRKILNVLVVSECKRG